MKVTLELSFFFLIFFYFTILIRDTYVLVMSFSALCRQQPWVKDEYVDRLSLFEEFTAPVHPDVGVLGATDKRGLIFSLY